MNSWRVISWLSLFLAMGLKSATGAGQKPDACQSRKVSEQPTIDYQVRGGLTGKLDNWLIYGDGLLCRWGGVDSIRLPFPGFRVPARRHLMETGKIPQAKVAETLDEATRLGFSGCQKEKDVKALPALNA